MKKITLCSLLFIVAICTNCLGRFLYVDINAPEWYRDYSEECPGRIIQQAIEYANNGDTILGKPGIYQENLKLNGKDIRLQGYKGIPVLEGGGSAYVRSYQTTCNSAMAGIVFENIETNKAQICNFIIKGYYTGIYCYNASPTIQNVTIVGNQVGIANWEFGKPAINSSIIWDNGEGIKGTTAKYSCIQNVVAGEGNIFSDPLFADENYHLSSKIGRIQEVAYGQGLIFDDPVKLEIDGSFFSVGKPFLTDDRSLLFFSAKESSSSPFRIYMATKAYPQTNSYDDSNIEPDRYENIQPLENINIAPDDTDVTKPWVSKDRKRIYYHISNEAASGLMLATWSDEHNDWISQGNVAGISQSINRSAGLSLSYDELTIYFHSKDIYGEIDIWTGQRNSIDEPFQNIHKIDEINLSKSSEYTPFITRDDQRLFFASTRDTGETEIFYAQKSQDGTFINITNTQLANSYRDGQPFVTFENQYIYFTRNDRIYYTKMHDLSRNSWVKDYHQSPCIDAGDKNLSSVEESYPNGNRINMGAYGGTSLASNSLDSWPNMADINRDGIVNMADVTELANNWLWQLQN